MQNPHFVDRIAIERNCSPYLVRAIVKDYLTSLHESTVKDGITPAMVGAYWDLGSEAAWHLGGIMANAAQYDQGEVWETYKRLDPSLKRFKTILDRWNCETEDARGNE